MNIDELKKLAGLTNFYTVENKIQLSTDPKYFGATVPKDYKPKGSIVNIPTNKLVGFEPDDKMSLPKSKANVEKIVKGLEQGDNIPPILVRKYKNNYQVVDGHHRFWAYKLLKKDSIPAYIVPDEDIEELTKENLSAAYADKRKKEREENIAPGSDEWFKLWFKRKPGLGMPAGFRGRKK